MKKKFNIILDCAIHIVVYALILILVSTLFKTVVIDKSYCGLYGLVASIIIFLLNKTVKPILFKLTVPITGIVSLFFTAVLISVMNILVDELIIKPISRKGDK